MQPNKPSGKCPVIGLAGGAGSGKSQVVTYLTEKWGAAAIILDDVARELQGPGGVCYQGMCDLFPEALFKDGSLDRRKIAESVYRSPGLLQKLNALVHPGVRIRTDELIAIYQKEKKPFILIESAIFFESGYDCISDEVWYIYAGEKTRYERLRASRGYSPERIEGIFRNQMPEDELRRRSDLVIDNDGEWEKTEGLLDAECRRLISHFLSQSEKTPTSIGGEL